MSKAVDSKLSEWEIEIDKKDESINLARPTKKSIRDWAPLFISSTFLADDPILELDRYACKDRKLKLLGQQVSR